MIMTSLTENSKLLAVLLIVLSSNVKAELIVKPKDAEAVVGGSTFFNCSTSLSSTEIHWFHYPLGATQDRSFVYGYNQFYSHYQDRFHMEKNDATGAYNLVISPVTSDDAGKYECQDDVGRGDKDSGELTVLDETPVCESNMKPEGLIGPSIFGLGPEVLQLSCIVLYRGNQPPILEWKEVGTESSLTEGVTRNVSNNRAMCYLTMEVSFRMDGSSYQCQTTRSATSHYGCTSDVVKVKGFNRVSFIVICVVVGLSIFIISGFIFFLLGRIQGGRMKQTQSRNNLQSQSTSKQPEQMELIQVADIEVMKKLERENERLMAEVQKLEQLLYTADKKRYRDASEVVHTIVTKASETQQSPITGIAILGNNMFVVSGTYPKVEVYDSKTFLFQRFFEDISLDNPQDIAISKEDSYLYVISRKDKESASKITRLDAAGVVSKCWESERDNGRLSVYESSVIVCFGTNRIINEYSFEGKTETTVRLSPAAGFHFLWHAIKLTRTNFAVSHSKPDGGGQRVCVVDVNGNVLMGLEELPRLKTKNKMNVPTCLAEFHDKSFLVADTNNNRVLLLNSNMKNERILVETSGNQIPVRLCLNETKDRLFVGVNKSKTWNNGCILIYNITE